MSVQKNTPAEMRKHVRQDVPGIVSVSDRQAKRKIGQLVNISEEGLMMLTAEPVAENAVFQLLLEFCNQDGESDPIEIGVESLWCKQGNNENQFWAGFYIIDISEQNQHRIRRMIG